MLTMPAQKLYQSRKEFLKAGALAGVVAVLSPPDLFAKRHKKNIAKQHSLLSAKIINKTRILGTGSAAMKVSAIGLGCMGMSFHRGLIPGKKYMERLLHEAVEAGINFFDTAEAYGPLTNETLVGASLHPFRNKIQIATKFGFKDGRPSTGLDSHPQRIRKVVEKSLTLLRIDAIDLLYQHRVDPNVPIEEVAGTVKDLIIAGKVKRFGLSEANPLTIQKAHAVQPLTAVQSEYSLLERGPEKEVINTCRQLGIGFVPYSPLGRAYLTGYLNPHTKFYPENDNRPSLPRFQPDGLAANWPLITALYEFGTMRGLTCAQVALAWLLAQEPWIVPIPGTTKTAHLHENIAAANITFDADELKSFNEAISHIKITGERYTGTQAQMVEK